MIKSPAKVICDAGPVIHLDEVNCLNLLDAGETEALALMERNPQAIFLTDDAAARLVAEQMRYNVHGTIGILLRSIRRGQRNPKEILRGLKFLNLQHILIIMQNGYFDILKNLGYLHCYTQHREYRRVKC